MKFKLPISLLFAASILISSVHAQTVKKIKKKISHGSYTTVDTYDVLKSNPDIKHGEYSSTLVFTSEKGQYDNGKKIGVWRYYRNNIITQEYDADKKSLLLYEESKLIQNAWIIENGNVLKETDARPVFLGGDDKIFEILLSTIKHPGTLKGTNVLLATITKEGKMINPKIESKVGFGTDEEFLRIFNSLPQDWIPAYIDEKPIDSRIQLVLNFTAN
ncbi:hypothetical protein [Pedobacter frigoris]|uniref:hypothetical protein n=1 Tax=Pedobacter frigoris TaxID=2571272 RepID=UPI00292D3D67|nr:hypothetical protein [Pedobacter frigoris]